MPKESNTLTDDQITTLYATGVLPGVKPYGTKKDELSMRATDVDGGDADDNGDADGTDNGDSDGTDNGDGADTGDATDSGADTGDADGTDVEDAGGGGGSADKVISDDGNS